MTGNRTDRQTNSRAYGRTDVRADVPTKRQADWQAGRSSVLTNGSDCRYLGQWREAQKDGAERESEVDVYVFVVVVTLPAG